MRALLLFLCCFAPLASGLWFFSRDARTSPALPRDTETSDADPVLTGTDLADAHGTSPFHGALRRLDKVVVQLVEPPAEPGGLEYVRFYIAAQRLARHEGRPRLEEILVAWFDPPQEGRARLRLTLECAYATADPSQLLRRDEERPRIIGVGGGVVARDDQGRPVGELDSLAVHIEEERIESSDPVTLRTPDRRATVKGVGVVAAIRERIVTLRKNVEATVDLRGPGESVTFSCDGPARVSANEDQTEITLTLEENARIVHPLLTARCASIEALLVKRGGEYHLQRARLDGGVDLEVDPAGARGLESVTAPTVHIEGGDEAGELVRIEGPVHAVRVGPIHEEFGLGDRRIALRAGGLRLRMRKNESGTHELVEALFEGGVSAIDAEGAGHLIAGSLLFDLAGTDGAVLGAWGGVEVKTPRGLMRADRLRATRTPGREGAAESLDLTLEGEKRVEYDAEGRLGPGARSLAGSGGSDSSRRSESRVSLVCGGPLRFRRHGEHTRFSASEKVTAAMGEAALDCDALEVELDGRRIDRLEARGGVVLRDPSRALRIEADRFDHDGSVASIAGAPASVREGEAPALRSIEARLLTLLDDGTFQAMGEVLVQAPLGKAGAGHWKISCAFACGRVRPEDGPVCVVARGKVRARGPEGEEIAGDSFAYDATEERALLLGEPATVARGEGLLVSAGGFELGIVDKKPVRALTRGAGTLDFLPGTGPEPAGLEGLSFKRWHVSMKGPCLIEGDLVLIPGGAALAAFDEREQTERPALTAEAGEVRIRVARTADGFRPKRLDGARGVRVERKGKSPAIVTADRLGYDAGSKEVELLGNGSVQASGWESGARYERLIFVLRKDGVDLKRASRIAIGSER